MGCAPVGLFRAVCEEGEEADCCGRSREGRDLAERGLATGDITPACQTYVSPCYPAHPCNMQAGKGEGGGAGEYVQYPSLAHISWQDTGCN